MRTVKFRQPAPAQPVSVQQDSPSQPSPNIEHTYVDAASTQDTVEEDYDDFDDFDFVEAYDDDPDVGDERMFPENTASSAIKCAFLGVGGGGGKLAKAFLRFWDSIRPFS